MTVAEGSGAGFGDLCKRRAKGRPGACRTRKSVGIRRLVSRISAVVIPYRGGSTKSAVRGRGAVAFPPASCWEIRQFRAFAVRDEMNLTGGVTSVAPRVVLRFEGLKNEFGS